MGKGGQKHPNNNNNTTTTDDASSKSIRVNNNKSTISRASAKALQNIITPTELQQKCTLDECWLAYEGVVYDVTHWLHKHPGGIRAIMSAAGQDATSVMKSLHHPKTLESNIMKRTRIVGTLQQQQQVQQVDDDKKKKNDETNQKKKVAVVVSKAQLLNDDFEQLSQELLRDGWYEAKVSAYFFPVIRAVAFLSMGLWLVYQGDALSSYVDVLSLVVGSILIGLFFQNIAFLGHDAGHGSITGRFDWDLWLGLVVGNGLTGIDLGWWKSTHYVHHSATNSLHDDPDIQHMPLLCFEERFAAASASTDSTADANTTTNSNNGLWSTYHGHYLPGIQHALCRYVVPYQHFYFYPVLCVARFSLHVMSIVHVLQTCPLLLSSGKSKQVILKDTGEVKERYAWPKPSLSLWLLQVGSLVFYWTMLVQFLCSLESWTAALTSFGCIYVTTGILHVQIVLSHIPMQYCEDGHGITGGRYSMNNDDDDATNIDNNTNDDDDNKNEPISYYEWQALSTMDVDCPPWMDWFHGGLQFQLEHHLFPRIPRRNLRPLMKKVDAIFEKHAIPVTRKTFLEGNLFLLQHMKTTGAIVGQRAQKEAELKLLLQEEEQQRANKAAREQYELKQLQKMKKAE